MPREQYVNDSAHHGLSMDEAGTTLCAAGTMDDYAALVDRRTMTHKIFDTATTGHAYAQALLDDRGSEQHLLDLAQRGRLGGGARLQRRRRSWPTCRSATTRQRVRHGS